MLGSRGAHLLGTEATGVGTDATAAVAADLSGGAHPISAFFPSGDLHRHTLGLRRAGRPHTQDIHQLTGLTPRAPLTLAAGQGQTQCFAADVVTVGPFPATLQRTIPRTLVASHATGLWGTGLANTRYFHELALFVLGALGPIAAREGHADRLPTGVITVVSRLADHEVTVGSVTLGGHAHGDGRARGLHANHVHQSALQPLVALEAVAAGLCLDRTVC